MTTQPSENARVSAAGKPLPRIEFIALVAALMAVNAIAVDVMLPALPLMGEAFNIVNENNRQLVLSCYLIGFGIAQIAYGPLSDHFGRRTPLLISIVIYAIAAFAAVLAPNFITLLAFRVVQGIGAAGTRVIALSVVRDTHSGRAMAEVMSLIYMVFLITPTIAPGVGQLLLLIGPWTIIFAFMAVLGLLIGAWSYFRLPETLAEENRRPLTFSAVFEAFAIVFTTRLSIFYALGNVFIYGAMFAFINLSQPVFVDIYGLGPYFPVAYAGIAGLMSISSFINSRVVGRFGMRRIAHMAIIGFASSSIILFALSLMGPLPFPIFFALLAFAMFVFGWSGANMNTLAMEPLGKVAGTASSVFGFLQTFGGATLGMILGRMYDGTIIPLAFAYALMSSLTVVSVLIAEKGKLFGESS